MELRMGFHYILNPLACDRSGVRTPGRSINGFLNLHSWSCILVLMYYGRSSVSPVDAHVCTLLWPLLTLWMLSKLLCFCCRLLTFFFNFLFWNTIRLSIGLQKSPLARKDLSQPDVERHTNKREHLSPIVNTVDGLLTFHLCTLASC